MVRKTFRRRGTRTSRRVGTWNRRKFYNSCQVHFYFDLHIRIATVFQNANFEYFHNLNKNCNVKHFWHSSCFLGFIFIITKKKFNLKWNSFTRNQNLNELKKLNFQRSKSLNASLCSRMESTDDEGVTSFLSPPSSSTLVRRNRLSSYPSPQTSPLRNRTPSRPNVVTGSVV